MSPRKIDLPLLQTMNDIIQRAKQISGDGNPYRVAVAAAHDDAVIDAIISVQDEGIAEGVLVGSAKRILQMLDERQRRRNRRKGCRNSIQRSGGPDPQGHNPHR